MQDFYVLPENFIFSWRLARYVQDLVQDLTSLARKILARNRQVLQIFFSQNLQDLASNLVHILQILQRLALKLKFFLQDKKQESCKIFISCKKSFIFSARLASFNARSCKSCKKNTYKTCIFLARWFLLGITWICIIF